ncbi:MAG: hypothetical protein U9Q79_01135, partial [Candidatus Hydrogenedentes bacterium]|nr:hypothetical protein [Candidatus Hydrogenedentota bacterium]
AEKILEPGEKLPPDWPIAGTTGYDFLNLVMGLFIDHENENKLTQIYEEFIGEETNFSELVRTCKRLVLTELLGSELNRLTSLFVDICERHRRHRDYTRYELREALCETAVSFPVYRSYVYASRGAVSQEDEAVVTQALDGAKTQRSDLDPELFRFLGDLLLLRVPGTLEGELAMRFQQLTSPAMAKGLEDTAFYRYHRLTALNEVGGDPSRFGTSVEQLHGACIERQALHLRRRRPDYFGPDASYSPLAARGTKAKHAVAYLRGDAVVTVTPRLALGLEGDWKDTVLGLPEGGWFNVLTGDNVQGGEVQVEKLLARFPVGLFERKE